MIPVPKNGNMKSRYLQTKTENTRKKINITCECLFFDVTMLYSQY
ncbi:unnamed protein product, partial [Larinioides sclopetarius]